MNMYSYINFVYIISPLSFRLSHEIVPGYDFLVNAVWPEIVYCFELIAPVFLYAHGNPDLFHVNYRSTMFFLESFEHCCQVQTSVQRLRKHKSYKSFLNKWNLDVYFQIRFSEIAGKFEKSLSEGFVYEKNAHIEKGMYFHYFKKILWPIYMYFMI